MIGSPYYVAPEVLSGSYTEKWDIWGIGVIMFLMLSGTLPFNGKNNKAILKAVVDGNYEFKLSKWSRVSYEAKDLISKMLIYDPDERISASEALEHEWFKMFENEELESISLKSAFVGLKKFKAKQKMQQAVLGYLVTHLSTKEDLEEFDKVFKNLDKNHDGKVSKEEFITIK